MERIVLTGNRIWRWGEGGGALPGFWLTVVECSHDDGYHLSIYTFMYIIYEVICLSFPFVYPMYLSAFPLKSAVWQNLPDCQIFCSDFSSLISCSVDSRHLAYFTRYPFLNQS